MANSSTQFEPFDRVITDQGGGAGLSIGNSANGDLQLRTFSDSATSGLTLTQNATTIGADLSLDRLTTVTTSADTDLIGIYNGANTRNITKANLLSTVDLQHAYDNGDTITIGANGAVQIAANGDVLAVRIDSQATTQRAFGNFGSGAYTGTGLTSYSTSRLSNASASGTLNYKQHNGTGIAQHIAHTGTDGQALLVTSTNDQEPTVEVSKSGDSAADVYGLLVGVANAGAGDAVGLNLQGLLSSGYLFEYVDSNELPIKLSGVAHTIPLTERNTEVYGADGDTLTPGSDDVAFIQPTENMQLVLPTPVAGERNCYTICRVDDGIFSLDVVGANNETINGQASWPLRNPSFSSVEVHESITVVWRQDTSEWRII